jgi:hypothetical protein
MEKRLTFNVMNKKIDEALDEGARLYGSKASFLRALIINDNKIFGGETMAKKPTRDVEIPLNKKNCKLSVEGEEAVLRCKIPKEEELQNEEKEEVN